MARYLYGASVNGIQSYIFASNELKSIIGASELIKRINTKIQERYPKHIMLNAAGNIKLVFDETDKEKLEALVKSFVKEIRQEAFGLSIVQAVVRYEEGGLKAALEKLEKRLFAQRNRGDLPLDPHINLLKIAPKTARPLVQKDDDMATVQKEAATSVGGNVPKNSKNKTAIIHADGNGLGAKIAAMSEQYSSDEEVMEAYKTFSHNLDEATCNAFEIAKHGREGIRDVILGGDDMTIICDADMALSFAEEFIREFENETKRLMGGEGLTACAGIAYCNHKYPFHFAVNLAESLCTYAKKHSRNIDATLPPSSVMFHNIQGSFVTGYDDYIRQELTFEDAAGQCVRLNYGPYFIHDVEAKRYATLGAFVNLYRALMQKGSPLSRWREWLTILSQDATAADERLKRIDEMLTLRDDIFKKKSLENALEALHPDLSTGSLIVERRGERYTPIYDVIAQLSVIAYEKKKEEKRA